MCRLFGFRSDVPSSAHRSLVEAENAIANQACAHSDGWGIGYFLGEEAYILKADSGAADDERFVRLSRRLQSHAFVVHVRRATVGSTDYLNTHPFRHGAWVFAHNGTLWGFDEGTALQRRMVEATRPDLRDLVFGRTDSEHLFYYLLSALAEAGLPEHGRAAVDVADAGAVLREAVGQVFAWADELGEHPPLINFILTNGRVFFAQRGGLDLYLASQKRRCADYGTCPAEKICFDVMPPVELFSHSAPPDGPWRKVNHLLVASEPIGDEDLWEEVPEGMLLALDERMRLHLYGAPERFQLCPSPPAPPRRRVDVRAIGPAAR